jgi:hypothetical protein
LTDDVWRGLEQLHSGEHKVPYSVAKHNVAASSDVAELKRAWQTFLSQYMGISGMGRKGLLEEMHQLVEKARHVAEDEKWVSPAAHCNVMSLIQQSHLFTYSQQHRPPIINAWCVRLLGVCSCTNHLLAYADVNSTQVLGDTTILVVTVNSGRDCSCSVVRQQTVGEPR